MSTSRRLNPDGEAQAGTLTLGGREIPTRTSFYPVVDLRFYPENPRIYSIVRADGEPDQKHIEHKLSAMDHVKQLVQSIRSNGGLTDPLIVREGDWTVLEGNSRLAAYRILAANDPIKWGKAKCTFLPKDIGEDLVFRLLGEYHIIGKKDWAPYEQAGYLYRRLHQHGTSSAQMASEIGLSTRMVGHLISVYAFMVEHEDEDVSRWSYYDEYLKANAVKEARSQHPKLDKTFVKQVKSGDIPKAIDVREKVVPICAAGGKILKDYVSGSDSFDESYERAIARGADNVWLKRLSKFREQIADPEIKGIFKEMEDAQRKKCVFELKKIEQIVLGVLKVIS